MKPRYRHRPGGKFDAIKTRMFELNVNECNVKVTAAVPALSWASN
jgi:hypothetical protein